MKSTNVNLIGHEKFDGIIEKILIENDVKTIIIVVKQWYLNTYALSELKFNGIIFQSLPDISSFNLVNETTIENNTESILNQLDEYLNDNPSLILPSAYDIIRNEIKNTSNLSSYFFASGYCKDWMIVCEKLLLTEEIKS